MEVMSDLVVAVVETVVETDTAKEYSVDVVDVVF